MSDLMLFNGQQPEALRINGSHASITDQPTFRKPRRRGWQRDSVLEHLRSGRSLSEEEARHLYGCKNFHACVHALRTAGHQIVSERYVTEEGKLATHYWMSPDEVAELDPVAEQEEQQADTEERIMLTAKEDVVVPDPVGDRSKGIAVFMRNDGPWLQVGNEAVQLTNAQVRYLAGNMKLIQEMYESGMEGD